MPNIPGVSHEQAVRAFKKAGFWLAREGKHTTMTNGQRVITIPRHNQINSFTMGGIAIDAGLTVDEFKSLLK